MDARAVIRRQDVLAERVGAETVVYDPQGRQAHCLAGEVALVWEHCDGQSSVSDIAGRLALDPERVQRAVSELRDAGLLTAGEFEAQVGISRREATRRVAKLGAAALAAPLILSVAVPAAAAASSSAVCPPTCITTNPCIPKSCPPGSNECISTPVTCQPTQCASYVIPVNVGAGCECLPAPYGQAANGTPCAGGHCSGGVCSSFPP